VELAEMILIRSETNDKTTGEDERKSHRWRHPDWLLNKLLAEHRESNDEQQCGSLMADVT